MKPSKLTLPAIALGLLAATAAGAADRRTARVYVTNSKGNEVTVIDPATMKVVGTIDTGANPHGIVLSPDRRTVYISVEGTDELVAVDVATNHVTARTKVGRAPNEVSITRDGRKVFVPLRNDSAIDVVDTTTMKVVDRMKAPAWPHNTYVSADGRRLYLGSMAGSRITIYDTATHKQINEIAPGDWVRPIALRRDEKLAYVALSKLHGFVVVDLKQGKTIRRVELPALPPGTVIPPYDTLTHGLALTPDERELYVTSMAGKAVYAFSVPDLKQLAKIDVGRVPNWITISPDGRLVWVSNQLDDTVSAIDSRTKKVVATIPVGHEPKRLLAVDVDDSRQSSQNVSYPPAGDGWGHKRPDEVAMDSAKLEDAMQFARASEPTVFGKEPLHGSRVCSNKFPWNFLDSIRRYRVDNHTSSSGGCGLATSSAFAQQAGKGRPAQQGTSESKSMNDPPIACNLFGLTASERLRQQELHKKLFSGVKNVRELRNGYAVGLPGTKENILAIAEFISVERVCCSFFRFELEVSRVDEPVWLSITGGEGVKEFLKTQFKLK